DVDVDWNSRGHQLNMYQFSSYWGVNTSLYKSFLKGNLTFQLYAADLFGTIKQRQQLYFGKLRLINQTNEANSRQVSLTIRYKFNSANNKYKGSGAGSAQKNRL
ncbi:MAG: outer membrane beta-barrel family protein, partial [Prevotellaceae bacterium]|nr:outer membrane beta-barrel family protein [Prevotellaceae bacterium]